MPLNVRGNAYKGCGLVLDRDVNVVRDSMRLNILTKHVSPKRCMQPVQPWSVYTEVMKTAVCERKKIARISE